MCALHFVIGATKVGEKSGKQRDEKILLTKFKNAFTSTKSGIVKFWLTPYIENS